EGHTLALLGEIAIEADEPNEALECLEASLAIRRRIGDARGEGWMLQLLARAQIEGGHPDRARDSITLAERVALVCKDDELRAACVQLRASSGL
ncbi:MAG TPA: tetratricopeptide repeat protein, partial [Gemmatimonadaceae bacterium]|nr:tetratricopeptide repeat protein [Gemmatimonadaceae bacterium]